MAKLGNFLVRFRYNGKATTCQVLNSDRSVIAESTINRFHTDKPNKKLARKLTFTKVMKKTVVNNLLPKEERALIWNDFRNNITQPI